MALILGNAEGEIANSRVMKELLADLDRMIAGQASYLMPEQNRSLINEICRGIASEKEWEEKSSIRIRQLLHDIENAADEAALEAKYVLFRQSAASYFNRRVSVLSLHELCSGCRDAVIGWAIRSSLQRSSEPPAPFAICALGNYGRKEPTLTSPCDLLLLYDDTLLPAGDWFAAFAEKISRILIRIGLDAPFMRIDDPEWRGSLSVWNSRIAMQSGTPDPSSETVALCDLRPVYGNPELAQEIRALARLTLVNDNQAFMSALRSASIMPVGFNFFGRLRVEKSGTHRGEFNLMQFALIPMMLTLRMLSIQRDLVELSTPDRIKRLQTEGELGVDLAAKLLKAHHDFNRIKLTGEIAGKGNERDGFYLDREEISHDDELCLKQGLDALFNLQRIVYQNVET